MRHFQVYVPLEFFRRLLPINAKLINGNAFVVQACAANPGDGSVLRSREFLLFGFGLGTLLMELDGDASPDGYVMNFEEKHDERGVRYWEVQGKASQAILETEWSLALSQHRPSHIEDDLILIRQTGTPGQFFFLERLDHRVAA